MDLDWNVETGTGWIEIPGFGRINPRRDNVAGGRQYFTAMTSNGEYAKVAGESVDGGPETWHFEFDQSFWLSGSDGQSLEIQVSLLEGGRYAVRYRRGGAPSPEVGGGWR